MFTTPDMLPDILDFLFGERLQQIVFCSTTNALKDCIWMLIGRHHYNTISLLAVQVKSKQLDTCHNRLPSQKQVERTY